MDNLYERSREIKDDMYEKQQQYMRENYKRKRMNDQKDINDSLNKMNFIDQN